MGKKDKSKLIPVKKQVVDPLRGVIERIYWTNPFKDNDNKEPKSNSDEILRDSLELTHYLESIGKRIPKQYTKRYLNLIAEKLVPQLNRVEIGLPEKYRKSASGLYVKDANEVYIDDDVANYIGGVLGLAISGKRVKLKEQPDANFTKSSSYAFNKLLNTLTIPFHEFIHAGTPKPRGHTHSFEEGATELITKLFGNKYLEYTTQGTFKVENFTNKLKPHEMFFISMFGDGYAPYMYRVGLLGQFLGIEPDKYTELLLDFKLRDKDVSDYNKSFIGFVRYLKDKLPDNPKLKSTDDKSLDIIHDNIRSGVNEYAYSFFTNTEDIADIFFDRKTLGYAKVNDVISVAIALDSAISNEMRLVNMVESEVKKHSDPVAVIRRFMTYFQLSPGELQYAFRYNPEYLKPDKFADILTYMRNMFKYVEENYESFEDFRKQWIVNNI